jgi:hypothetical protein
LLQPIGTLGVNIVWLSEYSEAKKQIKQERFSGASTKKHEKFIPTFMFCLPTHENGNFFNPKLYCKGFIK